TAKSDLLSPSASLVATRTPPRSVELPATKKFATGVFWAPATLFALTSAPERTNTRGAPPGPPPKIRSANPSPLMSPTATNTPLRRVVASDPGNAKKSVTSRGGVPEGGLPVDGGGAGPAEDPGRHRQVGGAVVVHVAHRRPRPAPEVRVVDPEEVRPGSRRPVDEREDGDPRAAPLVGAEDHL